MSDTQSPLASTQEPVRRGHPLWRFLQRTEAGLVLAILAVLVLTTVVDRQHTYWNNPRGPAIDILRQTALLGIFALGAAIVIIAGGIDLSSGSVIAFGGSTCATIMLLLAPEAMQQNKPLGMGVIAAGIAGTLV